MARDIGDEQPTDEVSAPDMDRITATIRRVQAQAAAFASETPEAEEEDPIEATIRRVQAQAAAQESAAASLGGDLTEAAGHSADHLEPDNEAGPPAFDDDAIEATIRRVQEQAAAALSVTGGDDEKPSHEPVDVLRARGGTQPPVAAASAEDDESDPIEATIRRVQAQAAAQAPVAGHEHASDEIEEEDPIEATIRRVRAQAIAQASILKDDDDQAVPSVLGTGDVVEEAIRVAEGGEFEAAQPVIAASDAADEGARPEPTSWPGRDERLLGEAVTWEIAARRLEQGLQDAQREVRELGTRLQELERTLASGQPSPPATPLSIVHSSPVVSEDDEWDDRPQVSTMHFGTPPGPPVYRDPSPQTATAAELVEEPMAAVQQPAARLRAIDAEGNLDDRIPRQYRITVEDKRRGVDLVPLHRAMQGLENVKDMSLLSYSNGVAMVLVESVGPLDPEILRLAVGRVMSRETLVEVHNEQTMVLKIQE